MSGHDDWEPDETTGVREVADIQRELVNSAHLLVLSGRSVGQWIQLQQTPMVIGRGREAAVLLKDDGVSRAHASVVVEPDGRVVITDLGSTNKTVVEGEPVDGKVQLHDGDRIRIGPVILKFGYQDAIEQQFVSHLYASATRDWLTGAWNRRFFLEMLEREFAWHKRHEEPLTLLFVDIDHLSEINVGHGHEAGDVVLRRVADVCTEACRLEDMVARYGGEEFGILLRRSPDDTAHTLADRIRQAVEQAAVQHGEAEIPVTVSIGVVSRAGADLSSPSELITAAEALLEQAKEAGRNRIMMG